MDGRIETKVLRQSRVSRQSEKGHSIARKNNGLCKCEALFKCCLIISIRELRLIKVNCSLIYVSNVCSISNHNKLPN